MRRSFGASELRAIKAAIREAERGHTGEIHFAIEPRLNPISVLTGLSTRDRAIEAFSQLRVWDTADNNGVLIYLLWSERSIEIIADRGFNQTVSTEQWEQVCKNIEHCLRQGPLHLAVVTGITEVGKIVAPLFAGADQSGDELSNQPTFL